MADKKISQLTGATTPLSGAEVLPIVQSDSTVKVSVNDLTVGKAVVTKTIATSTTNSTDNATFESTTDTGIYVRWKRPNKSYILSLDINNNGGKNFSIFDETASATRFDISNDGDVTVNTGNLIQGTAAKGINFTANTPAAGMTSQLLNWYEEGDFTPSFGADGSQPTVTYSTALGKYTKIGDIVYFTINIIINTISGGAGALRVYGLPFVSGASTGQWACTPGFVFNWVANAKTFVISAGTDNVLVYKDAGTNTLATPADLQAGSYTNISGFYKTS